MTKKQSCIFVTMFMALLFAACANIGAPTGGLYDETPPKVVKTSPRYGAAKSNAKKIVLEFDENVKLESAYEKVVISPPQREQPEISSMGKKITVQLMDSLIPNSTYTIDFADAIVDNNEGNPMGDYAFTFSTGEKVDTMQVSGYVLNAADLEPIKGILVGLYSMGNDSVASDFPDSTFHTKPFERISRTDGSGHFIIKGIAPGNYRVFALKDQNENFYFDQKSEIIAFTDRVITPSCRPDVRQDTVWHDSIHYDSIVDVHYTHFFPDDIALLAFSESGQDRYLLKSERPVLHRFTLFFSAPSDTLPTIKGINFDEKDAFVIEHSQKNDTLTYWIRDSLIYNIDTLEFALHFYATDTAGVLTPTTDTLRLVSKLTKARMEKDREKAFEEWAKDYREEMKRERKEKERQEKEAAKAAKNSNGEKEEEEDKAADEEKKEENNDKTEKKKKKRSKKDDDEIEIPPMPEEFMDIKMSNTSGMAPNKNVDFVFPEPIDSVHLDMLHFSVKVDSILEPAKFLFKPVPNKLLTYRLYAEWEPDKSYELTIDTGAFVNIYGKRSCEIKRSVNVKSLDSYSTLFLTVQGVDSTAIAQLMDGSDKVVATQKVKNGKADFYFIDPSTYYLRLFLDKNGNGVWDTGNYDENLQAEPVYYYPGGLQLKAKWDISQSWSPLSTPIPQQKPSKITKQKPDKKKEIKSRNAELLKKKK